MGAWSWAEGVTQACARALTARYQEGGREGVTDMSAGGRGHTAGESSKVGREEVGGDLYRGQAQRAVWTSWLHIEAAHRDSRHAQREWPPPNVAKGLAARN